jgi:hypothetical protein
MITCEFMNRLGNNMFQIAVTHAIADKYMEKAEFPPFHYFNLPPRSTKPKNWFVQKPGPNDVYDIPYQPDLCLSGWFQRHEYFDHIREKLIEHVFKVPQVTNHHIICLHIRRGDFLDDPVNFPTQPQSYYFSALKEIGTSGKQIHFCSDDIEYCRHTYGHLKNTVFRENTSTIQDIEFMASAGALVISNSTMGFWGGYLGSQNRKIIFPENWFAKHSKRNGSEICPTTWSMR